MNALLLERLLIRRTAIFDVLMDGVYGDLTSNDSVHTIDKVGVVMVGPRFYEFCDRFNAAKAGSILACSSLTFIYQCSPFLVTGLVRICAVVGVWSKPAVGPPSSSVPSHDCAGTRQMTGPTDAVSLNAGCSV